ncbi:hypothetical protein [Rickettsiella endosymbiont of Aleochara curtula]|uniref:hypothetical protein n=1 Tax=Rickettsiella endosymbiont of Aleochara curtula TaxID=3077936 RepID=UPI00313E8FBD
MNREMTTGRRSFFTQRDTKQRYRENWVSKVNQFNKKSIYDLTWKAFYHELCKLGIKEFLNQYGYSSKRKLQLVIAKSNLCGKKVTLYDFENSSEPELIRLVGNNFFGKITNQINFNAKNHKLSTIHYYIYHYSLNFTALSLGFSSKQCFLNFFAQTLYVPECLENIVQNLRRSIESLRQIAPANLRKELSDLYDKPLPKNRNFIKYNSTLEELKLGLENESTVLVVASLGGSNAYIVNKKLQTLRPLLNVNLRILKQQSWESLQADTPIFIWKIKLYQLFSGQVMLDQWPATLYKPLRLYSFRSYLWQFFTSRRAQEAHTDTPLNLHHSHPSVFSFYSD